MRKMLRGAIAAAAMLLLLLPVGAAALGPPVRYVDTLFADNEIVVTPNVVYGQAPNYLGELQELKLDVYEPSAADTETSRGLYIWVHGGNFREGSKSSIGPLRDYVRRGWVGISIQYRLNPTLPGNAAVGALIEPASLPAFIAEVEDARHDAQAAVRWARAHAAELGVDPMKIAMGGMSAGAITSLNVAFNPNDPGSSGTPGESSAIAAVVSHAGTYAPGLLGDPPVPGGPPIAMYHGVLDEQVPYPTAPIPCVLQLAVGNTCEYVTYLAETHRTLGTDLARDFLYRHVIKTETRVQLLADLAPEPVSALARLEPAQLVDLGVTLGVVSPTDPDKFQESTLFMLRYILNALGIESPV